MNIPKLVIEIDSRGVTVYGAQGSVLEGIRRDTQEMDMHAMREVMVTDERGTLRKPPPPKIIGTEAPKPWVIVVWDDPGEDMWVYGPYACQHDALMAEKNLITFQPHAVLPCEDLDNIG